MSPRAWLRVIVTEGPTKTVTSFVPSVLFLVFSVFFSFRCVPMDPLVRPEFLLLLLEQEDRSLEDHTRLFLCVVNATSYPDDTLCSFYDASLNTASRALSSEDGPREDFTAFVEWTLARNGSPLTVSPEDDLARSTPDPEPSPPSPRGKEHQPEPTDDGEPFPSAICEPALSRSSRKLSPTRQTRCESRRQCPSRGSKPWTVWARSGALPPAPRLRVSC